MAFSPGPFCSIRLWLWSLLAEVTTYLRAVLTSNGGQMILESSDVLDSLQKWIQRRSYWCRAWTWLLRWDQENCELGKKWVGSGIKDQIDAQLKGSLNSEVHHSNLIRLKWVLPRKESALWVTGNRVYLKDSLFLVIPRGESSQEHMKMKGLLHLTGDGRHFGLPGFRKCDPEKIPRSCDPVQREHATSEVPAWTVSTHQTTTFGRSHLLPPPVVKLFLRKMFVHLRWELRGTAGKTVSCSPW